MTLEELKKQLEEGKLTQEQFDENHRRVCTCVENIVRGMNA